MAGPTSAAVPAVDQAAEAIRLASVEPERAREQALSVRDSAVGEAEPTAMVERALGLAAMELGDLPAAETHLRTAVRTATRAGLRMRAAEARMSLALVLTHRGKTTAALRHTTRAARVLTGLDAARLQAQRALILQRLGRDNDALSCYSRSLTQLRRHDDRLWQARLLSNRGVLHAYSGRWEAAEADLARSEELFTQLGHRLDAAGARHNRGFVAALRGDVPTALALYQEAEDEKRQLAAPIASLLADRAELLLTVGLVAEARRAAQQAVEGYRRQDNRAQLAEARLTLARAALEDGDPATARSQAVQARTALEQQRRGSWTALARYLLLRADSQDRPASEPVLDQACSTAADLEAAGWDAAAADARLIAARTATALGATERARQQLERAAADASQHGPLDVRVRARHADALLRLAENDRVGADAALRAGLRLISRYQAALGATELRAHVASHGDALATLGLQLALASGDPGSVLAWAERWRAGALRLRPARPPKDAALASALADLRRISVAIDDTTRDGEHPSALLRRRSDLEETVLRLTRQSQGAVHDPDDPCPPPDRIVAALDGRALVEVVEVDGMYHAVVVCDTHIRLRALARRPEVLDELDSLRFNLRRLARRHGTGASLDAARLALQHAAGRLDGLLLGPLRDDVGDRPLVVVPTGELHALPWAVLPSCADRPVAVAPSAATWLRAATRPPRRPSRRVALVAPPAPRHAATEVDELASLYPDAVCLRGRAARSDSVIAALNRVDLAHIACHGHFRADNPLFSSLELADGPLTVYDLEELGDPPRVVVLSGCHSAMSQVCPGDELMGLAAALLALGCETLVASVIEVPDRATRQLMIPLHRNLQDGAPPSVALSRARQELLVSDAPDALAAAAAFVCIGAG